MGPNDVCIAYAAAGQYGDARSLASWIAPVHAGGSHRALEAEACWVLGECATLGDSRDLAEADAHYRTALSLAMSCERRPLAAECRLGLGVACRLTHRDAEARQWLAGALAEFTAMDMPESCVRVQSEFAGLSYGAS
jgi:hypothetical protein